MATPTFSDLIRRGSLLRPQTFGAFFTLTDHVLCSCASGAAIESAYRVKKITFPLREIEVFLPKKVMDVLADVLGYYPDQVFLDWNDLALSWRPEMQSRPLANNIIGITAYMNDVLKWSREKIADFWEARGY